MPGRGRGGGVCPAACGGRPIHIEEEIFMKKRIYLACALLLPLMSFLFLPAAKTAKAADPPGGFMYYSDHFNAAPLTFEAWIRLPEDLPDGAYGGTVLGNYCNILRQLGLFNFEIHTGGNFRVYWETGAFAHVFTAVDFRTGNWEHVALVREPGRFVLYHNGEIAGQAASDAPLRPDCTAYVGIGNDYRQTPGKRPFQGDIRQITVYSEPVTQARVRADMANGNIADGGGFNLLASWYWGDDWGGERAFADLSGNGRDALFGHYDTFYGLTPEEDYDYTIVFMPDTQIMTNYDPSRYVYMANWVRNNAGRLNIKFLMHLGDIIDGGPTSSRQWQSAVDAMNVLYGTVPHSFIPGNHDYDDELADSRSLEEYNRYFPYDKYSVLPTFGGAFVEGEMENTYHLFEAGDAKYLVLALEYAPRLAVLEWANRVIAAHPARRAIVTTHAYMGWSRRPMSPENGSILNYGFVTKSGLEANDGIDLWNKSFRHHDNLFMVASGHVDYDNVMYYEDKGLKGNRVHQFLIDGQHVLNQPEDLLFIMRVNERTQTVHANYYSPFRDKYFNAQNQISFSFADENNPAINIAQGGGGENETGAPCDCAPAPGGKNGCSQSAGAAFALTGLLAAAVLFLKRSPQ
jgi:hypothetical protein